MGYVNSQHVPEPTFRQAHVEALTRMFRRLDALLGDLRALAGDATYRSAAGRVETLKEGAATAYLDLGQLATLRDEVERQVVEIGRAVEARRGGAGGV